MTALDQIRAAAFDTMAISETFMEVRPHIVITQKHFAPRMRLRASRRSDRIRRCYLRGNTMHHIGERNNRLVMIGKSERIGNNYFALFRCDCGVEKKIRTHEVFSGHCKSCGCLSNEKRAEHGRKQLTTHGMSRSSVYHVWNGICQRCHNPKSKDYFRYGGRGIFVCDEWRSNASAFLNWALSNGYEKGLQLDRIDNGLGYSPDNCRFVTCRENNNNKRRNFIVEFHGEKMTIPQAIALCGTSVNYDTILRRIQKRGMTFEQAVSM